MPSYPSPIDVEEASKKIFSVFYGLPHCGKTILASRIAELYGRSLIVTDESGHLALKQFPELQANTQVIPVSSITQFKEIMYDLASGQLDYPNMIVDTFTGMVELGIREGMQQKLANGQPNPRYLDTNRNNPEMPVLQDYLYAQQTWLPITQFLAKQNKYNVFLNCHIRTPDPTTTGPDDRVTRPELPKGVWRLVNGKANVVAYMMRMEREGTEQRIISMLPTTKFAGKNQLNLKSPCTDDEFVEGVEKWRTL